MQLPSTLESSHKEILKLQREVLYLTEQLRLTRARIFGKSSERRADESSSAQVLLFENGEIKESGKAQKERIEYEREKPRKRVEGKLPEGTRFPEYLPREETIIDDGGEGKVISERITERLAVKGSPFYVKRFVIRKRTQGSSSAHTPHVPQEVLERTSVDVSFLVYVTVAKYVWHLPLYRQEQILKAQGISISRDTLIRYVISISCLLKPIYQELGAELFEGAHLFGDETPVLVGKGEKGRKQYGQSYFWTFLGDAGCAFFYAPTRAFKEVEPLLKSYSGTLQSDGYRVYEMLSAKYPEILLVGCWAHARRKFIDAEKGGDVLEAKEALRYIRALYRVESRIRKRELEPPEILKLRQRFSKRILAIFELWLKRKASDPRLLPKGLFGTAISYTLKRWDALLRYCGDPKLAIDSNAVEREIRPVALGKKNWMFCASEVGAEASAILYSLIASCRLAGIDPTAYLADVLERISSHPASKVAELIPVNWQRLVAREHLPQAA